ncbi:MAG: DegT/DnrJ/EryC1/StrS family aminotransferase [Candidatus Hydrogenedentes bacterium]|nr:DegT/DnrJ/EryC1/StrS family aminotransferase [Candidatus Hydrogenedentota bacterium]
MGKLAINGGTPVRKESAKWPQWPIHTESDVRLLSAITKSNRWSFDGPYEWQFAREFAAYHRSKYGLCCANGTVGIQLAMEALDIGAYDEVIVPGITWQATAAAVLDVNAVPVLVDVEPDTWCLDLAKVEAAITKKTKAVIVVHLYGSMADMTKLQKLCKNHGLYLIEDCAHQHGAFWKGKGVGALGDIGSFSFQESKVLSCGEGGFNMCQDKVLFERLYSLRNCGRGYKDDFTHAIQSGNFRLTEWQAGILLGGLSRLDAQVKHRDENAIYLNSLLAQIPGIVPMRRRKEITQASYFNFAFRLDWNKIPAKGINNAHFSAALSAETGAGFEPPYEPLNRCSLYKPHTKRRHNLSPEYWKKIDPSRLSLPVCESAHFSNGVAVHHHVLLGTKKDMECIATAVAKVVENIGEINPAGPQAKRKRYRALAI